MITALFGIEDGSLSLAVNLLILTLVVVYLALIYWTYADARRRIDDSWLVACATAASLFPFIGTVVYTILRPPEYLADARERDLETRAAELRLRRLTETSCPRCEHPVELSWLRCPECQHRLKDPCRSCGRPVDSRWAVCPHCETAVASGRSSSSSRQGRPRSSRSSSRPSSGRPEAPKRRSTASSGRQPSSRSRPTGERRPERSEGPPKRRATGSPRPPGSSGSQPDEARAERSERDADADAPRRRTPKSKT